MTPEQKAAFINAQTQLMIAEREIMLTENAERIVMGCSPAHGSKQWADFKNHWEGILGWNAVLSFYRS